MDNIEPKKEEGVDFSHFFKPNPNPVPAGNDDTGSRAKVKKYIAVLFIITAFLISGYLVFKVTRPPEKAANYEPPAGYRMVSPPNEPPKLEKIK